MDGSFKYGSFTSISTYFSQPLDIDYYWKFLIIIGGYYILPSLQFVFFQAKDSNVVCYYNFKCKHDLYFIPAFNNIISNFFYILLGLTFIIIVRLNTKKNLENMDSNVINNHPALYYSLGLSLFFEGLCSSIYHICPSMLNFQFDTTFMFIGAILISITIYQKRHGAPPPMKVYCYMGLVIFINTLPLSGLSQGFEIWFWGGIFLLMAYLMVFGSIYLYYDQEYDFEYDSLKVLYNKLRTLKKRDVPKFMLIISINTFTLGMYIYATITKPNFTDWLLGVTIINMIIYFLYYIMQKINNREKISYIIWIWLLLDIIVITLSLIFFLKGVTNKLLPLEKSNKLNKPCVLFNYFDYHDIWHIFSSIGLFIFINIVYFMDNNTFDEEINIF
jgi:hypothetical protein